jgi:hypothetical protein
MEITIRLIMIIPTFILLTVCGCRKKKPENVNVILKDAELVFERDGEMNWVIEPFNCDESLFAE